MRASAAELVGLAPDVIITSGGATTRVVQQQTKAIPIVFTVGPDPLAAGILQTSLGPRASTGIHLGVQPVKITVQSH
jgi:ABC-type uncharacterized transport system substrate-binding protein